MAAKLNNIKRTLQERFGNPIVGDRIEALTKSNTCQDCGGMMELEGTTCSQCGMMDEVDIPGNDNNVHELLYYEIIDRKTGAVVGKAKTRRSANISVDRRDNEYGAYRYYARPVYAK